MVSSRLPYVGYGPERSRRAMDRGFFGHDVLIALDEAHLAPAIVELLRAVSGHQGEPDVWVMVLYVRVWAVLEFPKREFFYQ